MPRLDLLILNGASGTGKTATAQALTERINNVLWVHPDELWDTPNMEPEPILRVALEHAFRIQSNGLAIVDCQIRPTSIPLSIGALDVRSWVSVLHTCPKALREKRLLARGWTADDFGRIERWANMLHTETVASDGLVVDTSVHDTQAVCSLIFEHIRCRELRNDA